MLSDVLIRLRALLRRNTVESELDEELRFHFDQQVEKFVQSGLLLPEARRRARLVFGGADQIKEECREAGGVHFLETLIQDIRYALRMLRKFPSFTVIAVLTLALGIGANTAVFSIVNGVLLKPLPLAQPDRLVGIFLHGRGLDRGVMGNADFLALHQRQQSFEHVAAFSPSTMGITLTGLGAPQLIPGTSVTPDFFSVLGVEPVVGRAFLPEEGKPGGPLSVVVSDHFWEEFLHSDPAAVGRNLNLDGKSYAVIGVMPLGFRFGPHSDLWPVLQLQPPQQRPPFWLFTIGRLKPGVSKAQASSDAARIAKQVQEQYPRSEDNDAIVVSMKELFIGDVSQALLILLGAVGFILLIAVVNVANLQLSRSDSRAERWRFERRSGQAAAG